MGEGCSRAAQLFAKSRRFGRIERRVASQKCPQVHCGAPLIAHVVSEHAQQKLSVAFAAGCLGKLFHNLTELGNAFPRIESHECRMRAQKRLVATRPTHAAAQRIDRTVHVAGKMLKSP